MSEQRRFETEQRLEDAVAAHPEVLPAEDLGLGPLVCLGRQVDFGAGPIDLLAADPQGRLAIVEFKRGSENPDVRRVVAQLLDYGSSLWHSSWDDVERRCAGRVHDGRGLLDLAAERYDGLEVPFEPEEFRLGVETSTETGDFVFVYVGRDLDERTRRIMTYLAEGPRMRFFGVEVDYYARAVDGAAVLVPRTAFVPTWIADAGTTTSSRVRSSGVAGPPGFHELVARMDQVARDLGLAVKQGRTGRNYQPRTPEPGVRHPSGIGVYFSGRGAEFNLSVFRDLGHDDVADDLLRRLRDVTGEDITAAFWPAVPCETLTRDWTRTRQHLIEPYFRARAELSAQAAKAGSE